MEPIEDLNKNLEPIGSKITSIVTSRKYVCYSSVRGRVLVCFYDTGEWFEL